MNASEAIPPLLRVLVVGGDPADAELALRELERGGFEVRGEVVGTREELVRSASRGGHDVVLADYRMTGWTGLDVLAELRQLGSPVPLILVTGTLGDELAVDCVKQGVTDYVLKGNLARLPLAVRRALGGRPATEELARAEARTQVAEEALLEREELFTQLAESISEVFFVMDAQFRRTLYISPAYEQVWGRSRETLYRDPKTFIEPIPEEDRARLIENIAQVQQGLDPGAIEFRVILPDGRVHWVLSHAIPLRNPEGAVDRIAGVALDITVRRAAQEDLVEREARYRALTEASFDAIEITQDGVILEVNRGFLEMFGYEREDEVVGRHVVEFCAEESLEVVRKRLAERAEGSYEVVALHKDGHRMTLEVTDKTHHEGGLPRRITALRDVTERRALEDQFRQAQKMEAVGRLAGGVAHDFNNLLTVITTFSGLLAEDLAPHDPRSEFVDEILKAAKTAAHLTRQLLAFSRQQVVEPRRVMLGQVVLDAGKLLERLIGEDVQLDLVVGADPLPVVIDPGQIEQVIMNLAINSRDAMPLGGKLTIETAATELDEDYAGSHWPMTAGSYALLAVSDSGVGMSRSTRARIFEPFFTTKEVGKGTGLGLATVYGIVKTAGGFIWVYSEPERGTTFKIYLPRALEGPADAPRTPALDERALRGSETVLVAEDAPAVRASIRRILERYGYTVREAPNGKAALAVAGTMTGTIDLLLTDVVMPEMSGRVLAERFLEVRPRTKVLYVSGYTDDAVLRHGVLEAEVAYLQKPFTAEALAAKVRAVLDSA